MNEAPSPFIIFNGTKQPADRPLFNSQNRAFRFGDGLFETMRMFRDEIPFLNLHLNRLHRGMKILGIEPNHHLQTKKLNQSIADLSELNGNVRNASVKLAVYRSGAGKYQPISNKSDWHLELTTLKSDCFELNNTGLTVDIYPELKVAQNIMSPFKTMNALPYVLAANYAKDRHIDDCILLNEMGQVCEATSSNVFVVRENRVTGVLPESGAVQGILQSVLPDICARRSLKMDFKVLLVEDLLEADELFLTNAVQGIRWVQSFRSTRFGKEKCVELVDGLNELVKGY